MRAARAGNLSNPIISLNLYPGLHWAERRSIKGTGDLNRPSWGLRLMGSFSEVANITSDKTSVSHPAILVSPIYLCVSHLSLSGPRYISEYALVSPHLCGGLIKQGEVGYCLVRMRFKCLYFSITFCKVSPFERVSYCAMLPVLISVVGFEPMSIYILQA